MITDFENLIIGIHVFYIFNIHKISCQSDFIYYSIYKLSFFNNFILQKFEI